MWLNARSIKHQTLASLKYISSHEKYILKNKLAWRDLRNHFSSTICSRILVENYDYRPFKFRKLFSNFYINVLKSHQAPFPGMSNSFLKTLGGLSKVESHTGVEEPWWPRTGCQKLASMRKMFVQKGGSANQGVKIWAQQRRRPHREGVGMPRHSLGAQAEQQILPWGAVAGPGCQSLSKVRQDSCGRDKGAWHGCRHLSSMKREYYCTVAQRRELGRWRWGRSPHGVGWGERWWEAVYLLSNEHICLPDLGF